MCGSPTLREQSPVVEAIPFLPESLWIFGDGFESGDTLAWSTRSPESGKPSLRHIWARALGTYAEAPPYRHPSHQLPLHTDGSPASKPSAKIRPLAPSDPVSNWLMKASEVPPL